MSSPEYVEQYLLFDHTEYIVGIQNIGTIALSELIYEEPREWAATLPELLQQEDGQTDHLPRLFEL